MWVASPSKGGAGLSGAGKEGRGRGVPAGWRRSERGHSGRNRSEGSEVGR